MNAFSSIMLTIVASEILAYHNQKADTARKPTQTSIEPVITRPIAKASLDRAGWPVC